MTVRELTPDDLVAVAGVHLAAFPDSALSRLGAEAVRRYYEWQLTGPHDVVALAAVSTDDGLSGFCVGGVFRGAVEGFVRRNQWYLIGQVASHPSLVLNPTLRAPLAYGLRSLARRWRRAAPQQVAPPAEAPRPFGILSIAVHPSWQGSGVGQHLMAAAESAARERGFSELRLSVEPANAQAIRFYDAGGWSRVGPDPWQGTMRKGL